MWRLINTPQIGNVRHALNTPVNESDHSRVNVFDRNEDAANDS